MHKNKGKSKILAEHFVILSAEGLGGFSPASRFFKFLLEEIGNYGRPQAVLAILIQSVHRKIADWSMN